MGRFTVALATGAGLALIAASGAAAAPVTNGLGEPTVTATYPIDESPTLIRYAYDAAWVATKGGTLLKLSAGDAEPASTARFPGTIVDATEGYGRVWVLWRKDARSYVASVNPKTGRIVGRATRTRVPGRPARIRAGAGALWVAPLGNKVTARGPLTRIDRKRLRAVTRRWMKPTDFFVERGRIYSFNGLKLVTRRPGDLRVLRRVSSFSAFQGVTYGQGNFWTSSVGTTGLGGVTRISPTKGRDEILEFPTDFDVNVGGSIVVGGGVVYSTWQIWPQEAEPQGASGWGLVGYAANGSVTGHVGLPIDGTPSIAYGAASLWVTDPGENRVLQIAPPTS